MNVADLLHSTRVILAETGVDPHPYRMIGAGFLLSLGTKGFLITAKHVLVNENPDDLFIAASDESRDALVISGVARLEGDQSFHDLVLLAIDSEKSPATWRSSAIPLSMGSVANARSHYQQGAKLAITGIPQEARSVDYEAERIYQQRVILEGTYGAPDTNRAWIHQGVLAGTLPIHSFAGFSGSPVLLFDPPRWGVAGVVIEGSTSSRRFHFVDSAVLWNAVHNAVEDLGRGAA